MKAVLNWDKGLVMSKTFRSALMLSAAALPFYIGNSKPAAAQELNSFAIVAGQSLTNTGPTTIVGNIAVSPGISFTGSGSVTQTGATFIGDAVGIRIQDDLTTLYAYLASLPTSAGGNLTGQDLGGLKLLPGVYSYDSSAMLSAGQTLTLDAAGDPDAVFIINIGSTLTVGSGANVILKNGAQGGNVFYRIGSSASLDTTADVDGQIVALTIITMNTSDTIDCGAAYARNGSVTLDTNTINICALDSVGFDDVEDGIDNGVTDDVTTGDGVPVVEPNSPFIPSGNTANVLTILADSEAASGVLPLGFAIIAATQTPEQIAESLSQLSGEVSTGLAPMGFQSMDTFLDIVSRPNRGPRLQLVAPKDQGVPVGLVPARDQAYKGKYDTAPQTPELTHQAIILPPAQSWNIWMSGYGARSFTAGLEGTGTHDSTSDTSGLAFGLDYLPGSNSTFGIAFGVDGGSFS
ncbi:MAG: ice-binding family protein, partial [Sedimentisphaerales bacterium]|nr:ice-binding family protein [Sedimentisphaerales bacterium]